jgi:hypothetical protein
VCSGGGARSWSQIVPARSRIWFVNSAVLTWTSLPNASRCSALIEPWRALERTWAGESGQSPRFLLTSNTATVYEDEYTASHVGNEFAARWEFLTYLRACGMRTRGVL